MKKKRFIEKAKGKVMMTVTVATLTTVVKARKVILKAMMWKVIASLTKKESFSNARVIETMSSLSKLEYVRNCGG